MTPLFQNLWTTEIPRALCLTFLHSLWQGLLLALLAAFIILLSPKAKPRLRYNLLAFVFAAFTVTVSFTFSLSFRQEVPYRLAGLYGPEQEQNSSVLYTFWSNAINFIKTHAGSLVLVWLIAFAIKSARLLQDLSGMNLLCKTGSPIDDAYWNRQLQTLQSKLNIKGRVQLRASDRLKGPFVSGILKPVILLPLGMLSQLPPDQVEAILLHELAHIRRKDYLFNLAQTFIETVFFFNPFLCWLSALLRTERENCCDAIVVSITQNKTALVKALLTFGTREELPGNLAMALGAKKTLLLDRVKRITFEKNKSLDGAEKSFLALFSIAILAFLCTFSWNIQQQLKDKNQPSYNQLLQQRPKQEAAPTGKPALQPGDTKSKAVKQCKAQPISWNNEKNLFFTTSTTTNTTTITTLNGSPGTDTLTLSRNILTDLEQAGVVAPTEVQSYRLNNKELVVNGIRQPESLHLKLKSKYVTSPGWAILYDYHSCT